VSSHSQEDLPERISISTESPNELVLDALTALIPGVFEDGVIDVQRLTELTGLEITGVKDSSERYGLMWAGKSLAVEALQSPSMAALIPDLDNSTDWDTAENIFIEGDNLEVLKLLQKAYNDRIKLIYIDPPYNTGNDFVYNDDFSQPLKHYLEVTGQVDGEGNRLVANTEVSGRKHSNWLTMMYPRLVLARNLLTPDGSIFVSIDDNEVHNLREMMDEIFGSQNFIGQFIWAAGKKNDAKFVSNSHEYILCYARDYESLRNEVGQWRITKPGLESIYKRYDAERKAHGADYPAITKAMKKFYRDLPESDPAKRQKQYCNSDARGLYFAGDIAWPGAGGPKYEVLHPTTRKPVKAPSGGWRYSDPTKLQALIDEDRIHFGQDETTVPCIKRYLIESQFEVPYSVFYVDGRGSTKRLNELLGGAYFDFPKDELVLQTLVEFASSKDGIILDFFAGSGTTAHSVLLQNEKDGGCRKFILINFPEPTSPESLARKEGIETVSGITRLRLKKLLSQMPSAAEKGLRCLRLSKSAFLKFEGAGSIGNLELFAETLDPSAHDMAIASEALLKSGVALDQAWKQIDLHGTSAIISGGVAVSLAREMSDEIATDALGIEGVHTVIFLEDSFAGRDSVKANAHFAFKQANKTMKTI